MRFLCRIGIHEWGKWRAGGLTEHFDDFSTKIPYKVTQRFYRDCVSCGWRQKRRRKA